MEAHSELCSPAPRVAVWQRCGLSARLCTPGSWAQLGRSLERCPSFASGTTLRPRRTLHTLTSANVGKCQTVLCRSGEPLPLSKSYAVSCEGGAAENQAAQGHRHRGEGRLLRMGGAGRAAGPAEASPSASCRRGLIEMTGPDPQHHRRQAACDVPESLYVQNTVQGPAASPRRDGQSSWLFLRRRGSGPAQPLPRRGRPVILAVPQGARSGAPGPAPGPGSHPVPSSGASLKAPGLVASLHQAGWSPVILGAPTRGAQAQQPLRVGGWVVTPSPFSGAHWGLRPGLSTLGQAVILAVSQGTRSGAQVRWPLRQGGWSPVPSSGAPAGAWCPLHVRADGHPVFSSGAAGAQAAEVTLPALLSLLALGPAGCHLSNLSASASSWVGGRERAVCQLPRPVAVSSVN